MVISSSRHNSSFSTQPTMPSVLHHTPNKDQCAGKILPITASLTKLTMAIFRSRSLQLLHWTIGGPKMARKWPKLEDEDEHLNLYICLDLFIDEKQYDR